jgi:Chalcone isomerase-like
MSTRRHALSTAIALATMAVLPARTVWAGAPEAEARAALQGKQVAGQALLRLWGFEIYEATLYASEGFDPTRFAQQRFGLELHYRRNFKGEDIARRSIDEMQGIEPLADVQSGRWQQAMASLFPDVKPGDRILGVHVPGTGARFYLNGRLLGEVPDEAFSARFFGIWLSPRTSQPRFRDTLLAQWRR